LQPPEQHRASSPPVGVPENARKCPDLPDRRALSQNEATAAEGARAASPELPDSARVCPIPSATAQYEPTAETPGQSRGDRVDSGGRVDSAGRVDPAEALSPRQLMAIDLLFGGYSFAQVCGALRIDLKTLYRWRQRRAFAEEIRRRYRQHVVARKPRARPEPMIPPARPSAQAADVVARQRERTGVRDHAYWMAVTAPGRELPPRRDDEPFWVAEIRKMRQAMKAD
jgi:hypothetical protein